MTMSMSMYKNTYICATYLICLLIMPTLVFSQNRQKTDSLLNSLKHHRNSQKENFKLMVNIAFFHPNLDSALFYANKSLELAININEPILQAEAWEEISHKERKLGNNTKSLEAALKALRIYESKGLIERQAASYSQLANNYMVDGNNLLAIKYLKKPEKFIEPLTKKEIKYLPFLI